MTQTSASPSTSIPGQGTPAGTTTDAPMRRTYTTPMGTDRQQAARDHLWMHMARHAPLAAGGNVPVITRGEGHLIYDDQGREYIDGLAGLVVVQVGHGREELAQAAARQAKELAFMPLWSSAHPAAIELAERLAHHAPGDLTRVFFTTGGGEAVESAWKLAKQYFKLQGKPNKTKVISRAVAYHGTPQGALSITGIPDMKAPFEPLVPGAFRVPNTNQYRAPAGLEDPKAFGRWAADRIGEAIEFERHSESCLLPYYHRRFPDTEELHVNFSDMLPLRQHR